MADEKMYINIGDAFTIAGTISDFINQTGTFVYIPPPCRICGSDECGGHSNESVNPTNKKGE